MSYCDWITERVLSTGLTQAEIASALGKRPSAVSQKLGGKRAWTLLDLQALNEILASDQQLRWPTAEEYAKWVVAKTQPTPVVMTKRGRSRAPEYRPGFTVRHDNKAYPTAAVLRERRLTVWAAAQRGLSETEIATEVARLTGHPVSKKNVIDDLKVLKRQCLVLEGISREKSLRLIADELTAAGLKASERTVRNDKAALEQYGWLITDDDADSVADAAEVRRLTPLFGSHTALDSTALDLDDLGTDERLLVPA